MNALSYARVDRRDFGALLSIGDLIGLEIKRADDYDGLRAPDGNAVLAVWSGDPNESNQLPHLLICQEGQQADPGLHFVLPHFVLPC